MINLEAKQEAIKKAYGKYWEEVRRCIDEKGWCYFNLKTYFKEDLIDSKVYRDKLLYRPKSLQGIENNNGWIRIESKEDLPKKNGSYFVYSRTNWHPFYRIYIFTGRLSNSFENGKSCFSHYQPIDLPKPPIY